MSIKEKRIQEIEKRLDEIIKGTEEAIESRDTDLFNKLYEEGEQLLEERDNIRKELRIASEINKGSITGRKILKPNEQEQREGRNNEMTNFKKDMLEKRAATLSTGVLIPTIEHNQIERKFNDVSGILDLVKVVMLGQGNSFIVPYVKSNSVGNITEEGAQYQETPVDFGEIEIDGIKLTSYMEYSEEVEKLPSADYQGYISEEVIKTIKRKMVEQIVKGNGTKQFSGLYNTTVAGIECDKQISTIDNTTLNKIVYGHNSSAEEVENDMVLFLNKKDLGQFASVVSSDGQPVYQIKFNDNGMAGFINGTKFCIVNSLNSLSDETVTTGSYTMVYMNPSKYVLPIFSNIDLKRDYSTRFREGMIAVKGAVVAGGSVANPYAMTRIKKA